MNNFSLPDFRQSSTEAAPESSSCISDDNSIRRRATLSDDGVLLASNTPKKRAGRKKFRETRHPVFRGVRQRNSGKWVCEVREPNKKTRIWLGTFTTPEMAARAHDVAAIAFRGSSACLNFADSAWKLPVPASSDAKSIQKAAAEAARLFGQSSVEREDRKEETTAVSPENVFFTDEEWPGLIDDMAEGLMMLPPPYCMEDDGVDSYADVPLWSYSI